MTAGDADMIAVNPADVDMPSVKAEAARCGLDVVASPYVPRGQMLRIAASIRPAVPVHQQED